MMRCHRTARVVVPVLIAMMLSVGCQKMSKGPAETVAQIQKREGIPVTVTTIVPHRLRALEVQSGTAEGYQQTTLTTSGAGRITAIKVRVGENVAKDASLMTIDPDLAQNYELAKEQFDNAEKTLNRVKSLVDQGGVAQEVLEQAQLGYLAARQGLTSARKSEFVLAPFAGTIVDVQVTPNSIIDKNKNLLVIASLDRIRVPLTVNESIINEFAVGQDAYTIVGPDTVTGRIEKVSLAGQVSSHSFMVDAVFNNPKRNIKPGMYLVVNVVTTDKPDVIALPIDNIQVDGANKFVYVVRNGFARKAPVSIGMRGGNEYEIAQGIAASDMVVASGAGNLTDSVKVKIVQ